MKELAAPTDTYRTGHVCKVDSSGPYWATTKEHTIGFLVIFVHHFC